MTLPAVPIAFYGEAVSDTEGSPGTTNLEAWWALDETSGTRVDSHGSNDLTDNNTVLYSSDGIKNNAADFEDTNSEFLSSTDTASLSFTDEDFSIALWVKFESVSGYHTLFAKSATREYDAYADSDGKVHWRIGNAARHSLSSDSVTTGTWYFMAFIHDATNDKAGIWLDDVYSESAYSGGCTDTASSDFFLGANHAGTYIDGLLDEVAIWRQTLDSDHTNWLYNSGSGRTYGDL